MARHADYTVTRDHDGAFRIERTTEPFPGIVARITPAFGRTGQQAGWRLKPLVTLHGATGKVWPTAPEAIAATKLMTIAEARRAVASATNQVTARNAGGSM